MKCFKHKYQYYHDIQFVIEGFKESIDKHMHTSERKQLVMSIFKKVLLFQVNLGKLVFWSMKKYTLTSISWLERSVWPLCLVLKACRGCWDCHISIIVNDFRNSLHMTRSYNTTLKRDTGATNVKELACLMEERTVWRKHVGSRLTKSTQWVRNHGRLIWRQHNHNPKLPIHIGYETHSYH